MDDPGCTAGKLISFSPPRGPLDKSLKSLAILDNLTANRRSIPLNIKKSPISEDASIIFDAAFNSIPLTNDNFLITVDV